MNLGQILEEFERLGFDELRFWKAGEPADEYWVFEARRSGYREWYWGEGDTKLMAASQALTGEHQIINSADSAQSEGDRQ